MECSVCDDREGPFIRFDIPLVAKILEHEATFIFCRGCIAKIHAKFGEVERPSAKDPSTLC